jgi:transcriptional antiterminator NusG
MEDQEREEQFKEEEQEPTEVPQAAEVVSAREGAPAPEPAIRAESESPLQTEGAGEPESAPSETPEESESARETEAVAADTELEEEIEAPVRAESGGPSEAGFAAAQGELAPEVTEGGPAWFVIHCYSGYENKVRHNLEQRIETMGMKDKIFDVVIPTQEEIEVRDGKRRRVERHIFPGYVLVNMALSEESWYVVRNTPGVTGFVGMGNQPTPLRPEEVSQIIKRMEADAPTVKVTYKVGERVRIVDGPFNDFRGVVSEIDMERTKVRVMVSFFGRETPVELDFLQVEKA